MRFKGCFLAVALLVGGAQDALATATCDVRDARGRALEDRDWEYGASIDEPISLSIPEPAPSSHAFAVVMRRGQPCFVGFRTSTPSRVRIVLSSMAAGYVPAIRLYAWDYDGFPEIPPESGGPQALSGAATYLLPAGGYVVGIAGDPAASKAMYALTLQVEDQTSPLKLETGHREPVRFTPYGRIWTRSIVVERRVMVSFLLDGVPGSLAEDVQLDIRRSGGRYIGAAAEQGSRSTFVLLPGHYLLDIEAASDHGPAPPLEGPLLTAPMTLTIQEIIPQTLPPSMVNLDTWLREVGLGNMLEVIEFADIRDPRRGLPGANVRLLEEADPAEWELQIESADDSQLAADPAGESATKWRPRFIVRLRTKKGNREDVASMEAAFEKRHGASLWNRVLQKVAATEALPAYDIAVVVPVPCDGGLVYMDENREAYRHGFMCISSSTSTAMPSVPQVASSARSRAPSLEVSLAEAVPLFLPKYIPSAAAQFEFIALEPDYAEVIIRGLRGTVIRGGNDWEKVQLTFSLTGNASNGKSVLRLAGDGQIASGMGAYPPDSQFIRDLEPKYAKSLQDYTKKTVIALRQFLESSPSTEGLR